MNTVNLWIAGLENAITFLPNRNGRQALDETHVNESMHDDSKWFMLVCMCVFLHVHGKLMLFGFTLGLKRAADPPENARILHERRFNRPGTYSGAYLNVDDSI